MHYGRKLTGECSVANDTASQPSTHDQPLTTPLSNRLLAELADAERYQEAYISLSEEVGTLLARNKLAEEETERLSKFNVEILSHNNPAQRISYVDRIRRELAEAKHVSSSLAHLETALLMHRTRKLSCCPGNRKLLWDSTPTSNTSWICISRS